MKKVIRIELDSDLIDMIQVFENPNQSFSEFVEKALEHIFQCRASKDIPDLWEVRQYD